MSRTFTSVLLVSLLFALASPLSAQVTFQRTYGGDYFDWGRSMMQTADGGYVIAGYTASFGAGEIDVYLLKTDANGDSVWTRTFGGTGWDDGRSVQQTEDGGFIIAGCTDLFDPNYVDAWLIKTNASGDTAWTRTYGGWNDDRGYSVAQTADGGYAIAGVNGSSGAGWPDVWLIKTDSAGRSPAIAEPQPPVAVAPKPFPTIFRNVLTLPGNRGNDAAPTTLMDISGRRVLDLSPGPNDISHLSPGVYFVHSSLVTRHSQPAMKVVIQR